MVHRKLVADRAGRPAYAARLCPLPRTGIRSEARALFGSRGCARTAGAGPATRQTPLLALLGYMESILTGHEELLGGELREDLDAVVGNHDLLLDSCC
jgi:hypothetical protein